jgi:hypothetical protein
MFHRRCCSREHGGEAVDVDFAILRPHLGLLCIVTRDPAALCRVSRQQSC